MNYRIMGMHEEMRAIDIFLSHSRAHTHWIGQQDLQADIGRVSKKSSNVVAGHGGHGMPQSLCSFNVMVC